MAGKGEWLQEQVLDFLFGLGSEGPPAADLYFALDTTQYDPDGTGGVEVAAGDYNRVQVAADASEFTRTGQTVTHDNDIDFGTTASDWGTVVAFSVWDASTAGNLIFTKALIAPMALPNGTPAKFPAGALEWQEI